MIILFIQAPHTPQVLARMKQTRFHGSRGATDRGSNAFDRIVDIEPQQNHLLLFRRQPANTPSNQLSLFSVGNRLIGTRSEVRLLLQNSLRLVWVAKARSE